MHFLTNRTKGQQMGMSANLKVGQKILVLVLAVGLALGCLLAVMASLFSQLMDSMHTVRTESVPNALVAKSMQMEVVQIQQWLTDISATRGQDGLNDGFEEAEKAYQRFLQGLATLRAAHATKNDAQGVRMADALQERIAAWYEVGREMAKGYIAGGPEVGNKLMGRFDEVSTQLQQAIKPLVTVEIDAANAEIAASEERAQSTRYAMILGLAVVVLLLAGGGVFLKRAVVRPLRDMSSLMDGMVREQDYSAELQVTGSDEIAQTGRAFNNLLASLRQVLGEVRGNVRQLDEATTSLVSAAAQASSSSDSTSESARTMSTAVGQLKASLDQVGSEAQEVLGIAQQAARRSDEGGQVVQDAVAEIQSIALAVREISAVVSELGQGVGRITNVVKVIREVADQTNLLALNAAIEAARAGEAGRGFAVVADEVRKLAERTSQSTSEIAGMINAIQHNAIRAVEVMNSTVEKVDSGSRLAESAGSAIVDIRSRATEVTSRVENITRAIAEEAVAGESIAQQVVVMARASEDSSHTAHQSSLAAAALEKVSARMLATVDQYRT